MNRVSQAIWQAPLVQEDNVMTQRIAMFCVMILLFGIGEPAYADITRSCEAFYIVKPIGFQGPELQFGRFSVTGSCGNRAVANRCRERARNKAHKCMQDHWKLAPAEVGPSEGDVPSPPKTCRREYVNNYTIGKLQPALRAETCERYRPRDFFINVSAVTRGDNRCSHAITLATRYRVSCGSGHWVTLSCSQPIDLDGPRGNTPGKTDLVWFLGADGTEVLRALNGASWALLGQGDLDSVSPRQLPNLRWKRELNQATGYYEIFKSPPHAGPKPGLFALRTGDGRYVVIKAMGYKTWHPAPRVCRDISVRAVVYR